MAVEIIIGRAGTGKTFVLLDHVKKILQTSPLRTEIIFLLPAYQTYRAELELAAITGGAVNAVMCSFQRFARQILSEVGGSTVPRISEIGRRIILRKILKKISKDLRHYQRAADQRGFTEILSQELDELRTYSLDAEKLRNLIRTGNFDDELKNKLHDLALLYEKFRAEISGRQNDESDLLERAAAVLKDSQSIKDAEIFVDGFIFFDPQQRNLLQKIFQHAKNVHVALPMEVNLNSRENVLNVGIFNRAFETFKTIRQLATAAKVDFTVTRLTSPRRFESAELKFIEENFFRHFSKKFDGDCGNLKVVEAVNKRVEVEAVARDILKRHSAGQIRFRDVGIIFRDDVYNNLIKPVFEIHQIPHFIDRKRAATHHPLAELIRSALEVLRTWRAESIFRCLRTGFFNVAQEEVDLLENYVLEFGLRGKKIWTQSAAWHWYRHGLDEDASELEKSRPVAIDEIRRRAVEPLKNFSSAVDAVKKISPRQPEDENFSEGNTQELTQILFEFIERLNVHEKLVEWSELEENSGNLDLSREHLKIWDDVVTLFEQIADSANEDSITLNEFDYIVNEGLDALEMSLIPPGLDAVTIAQFDQNSLQNTKAIYILGFSDKDFPRTSHEKLLLSDADRLHLNDAGLEISKGGNESLLAEKFLIYRGLTVAKKYLYVSYPLADSEGEAMHPSQFVDRLKNLFPKIRAEFVKLDVLENLGTQGNYAVVEPQKFLDGGIALQLYAAENKMRGSVTRFEKFNKCPFQYFATYGLRLEERREYKLKPLDVGNILHSIMRQFGEDLQAENLRWGDVGKEEISRRVEKILDELTPKLLNKILLSSKTLEHQRDRIKNVAIASLQRLTELDRHSKFHPEIFEATFNSLSKKALVYNIDGVEMELTGKIDRVDFSEDGQYFLIIDYKTGKAYLNLWEIYCGVNLQLLTYLMVTDNLPAVANRMPAAMLYYFLKFPTAKGKTVEEATSGLSKTLKMSGYVLDEKDVVLSIDDTLGSLPVALKKSDGNFDANTLNKVVKSREIFSLLMKHVEECLKATGQKILGGNVAAEPFKTKTNSACKYCAYAEVCRLDKKLETTPPPLDDEKIFEKMRLEISG